MSKSKTIMGFVAGAAVGILVGILLPPEKGSKSRKRISDMSGEFGASFTDKVSDLMKSIRHSFLGAAASADKLAAKSTSNMSDVILAFRKPFNINVGILIRGYGPGKRKFN